LDFGPVGGAKVMVVPHLMQENSSKRELFSSDLLPSIATLHTGQCWIGGWGCEGIALRPGTARHAAARSQIKPKQPGGTRRHRILLGSGHDAGNRDGRFDLDQETLRDSRKKHSAS
jgi:hypothetical protein